MQPAPVAETPAPVAAPVAPVAEAPAAPVAEAPVVPVAEAPAFADPFTPVEPPKAKKKGKGLLIAGIAVLAAAAVFVTCIAGPLWFGWFPNTKLTKQVTKWFGSDEAYMSAVESQTVDTLSNSISKGYGTAINTFKDVLSGDKYVSTTLSLEMGDTLKDMINSAVSGAVGGNNPAVDAAQISDLISKLDGAAITIGGGQANDIYRATLGLGIGGEELLSYDVIIDLLNLKGYMAIPTLSDTYLEISKFFEGINVEDVAAVGQATDLLEALPSEEDINNLLKKYIQLALDQFTDVSKDSDTLKVGGIEEKVTVLKTKIGREDLLKAAKAVMKELKKDDAVEDLLVDLGDALGAINGQENAGQQLYDSFVQALGMADAVEDEMGDYEDDDEDAGYIQLTDYVNGSHEIVGRKISMCYGSEKQEMFYYATATKGDNYAFELEVQGMKVLSGKGTNKKGIINGTYKVQMDEQGEKVEYATIKVENFDSNGFKANALKGTFIITPNAELLQDLIDSADLPAEVTSALSLLDCSLKIEVDMAADGNGYFKVGICNGSKNLVAIRIDTKITDEKVSVPSTDKTVDIENIDAWLDTVDLTKLINSLKKLGLPEEMFEGMDTPAAQEAFKEAFKEAFEQGFDLGFGGSSVAPAPDNSWNDEVTDYPNGGDDYIDWEDNWMDATEPDDNFDNNDEIVWGDPSEEITITLGEVDTDGDGVTDGIDVDGDGIIDYYVDEDGNILMGFDNEF